MKKLHEILTSGYTNIDRYRKLIKDENLKEVEINWIQDLGPIYKRIEDKPLPYIFFHNPKYKDDNEYLSIFLVKEVVHPKLVIDQIISNNGGSSNFKKLEDDNEYNYCFQGHLFWLGYLVHPSGIIILEVNRIKHDLTSSDGRKLLDGIHKDSKKINSLINGLNSLIYNSGEMLSGDGRLCYGSSGIVSWWSDPKRLIKRFKNIARNYQDNISVNYFEDELSKYEDLNESELVKNLDDELFSMKIKTKNFEISVSKGTSSYQMNINILKI